jgi:hypothetical protein
MPTSKLMQKLKKEHAKQVKKLKPGARNAANVKPAPKRTPTPTPKKNLTAAVAKMKAAEARLKAKKNNRSIKIISK